MTTTPTKLKFERLRNAVRQLSQLNISGLTLKECRPILKRAHYLNLIAVRLAEGRITATFQSPKDHPVLLATHGNLNEVVQVTLNREA